MTLGQSPDTSRRVPKVDVPLEPTEETSAVEDVEEAPQSTIEQKEVFERALDQIAENLLLRSAKVNEGMNGIILKLDLQDIDPEFAALAREKGIDLTETRAVKILKVYLEGRGKQEFEMQQRAYELLSQNPDEEALVPKPLFYRSFAPSEAAKERLRQMSGKAMSNAEVILMDFVDGIDVATILAREALVRRRPDIAHDAMDMPPDVATWTPQQILEEVGPYLGFVAPGGKGKTEGEREFERMKVEIENSKKLYDYLSQNGFQMDPTIVTRLRRTLDKLHGAGYVHRDAHERNFMVAGDYRAHEGGERRNTVYIIDFGTMAKVPGRYSKGSEDAYVEGDHRFIQDEMVPTLLEAVTREPRRETGQERARREDAELIRANLQEYMRRNKDVAARRTQWFERHAQKPEAEQLIDESPFVKKMYDFFFRDRESLKRSDKWQQFADYLIAAADSSFASGDLLASGLDDAVKDVQRTMSIEQKRFVERLRNTLRHAESEKQKQKKSAPAS